MDLLRCKGNQRPDIFFILALYSFIARSPLFATPRFPLGSPVSSFHVKIRKTEAFFFIKNCVQFIRKRATLYTWDWHWLLKNLCHVNKSCISRQRPNPTGYSYNFI